MSHMPLYRRDDLGCGADRLRESGHVTYDAPGTQYAPRDVISAEATAALLADVRPDVVLTGHTHTRCRTVHAVPRAATGATAARSAVEVTVPSLSWRMRPDPSFALLVVAGSHERARVAVEICNLPGEVRVIATYVSCTTVAALAWLWWLCRRSRYACCSRCAWRRMSDAVGPPNGVCDPDNGLQLVRGPGPAPKHRTD